MKLYNENKTELKDAKSFTNEETIIIYFSSEEDVLDFAELNVSIDSVEVLDADCTTLELNTAIEYAKEAQQSIIDYKNF